MDSSYSISRGFPADTTRATNTARRCRMSGAIEYTVPSSCARVAASSNVFCESASRSTCCDARERRNPSLIATARGDHGFAGSARRSANELFSTSIPSPWAATRTTTERRPASSSSKWAAIGAPRFAAFPIASARVSLLRVSARIGGRSCLPYSSPGAQARSAVSSNDTTTIDAPPNPIVSTTYSELSQAATLPRRRRTSRRNFSRSPYDDERARGLSVVVVVILARRARAEQTAVLADEHLRCLAFPHAADLEQRAALPCALLDVLHGSALQLLLHGLLDRSGKIGDLDRLSAFASLTALIAFRAGHGENRHSQCERRCAADDHFHGVGHLCPPSLDPPRRPLERHS